MNWANYAMLLKDPFGGDMIGIVTALSSSHAREWAERAWGEGCFISHLDAVTLCSLCKKGGYPLFTSAAEE